jgi:hypothetical protein
MKNLLFLLLISFLYLALYAASSNAQTMINDDYIIQMGNLNMSAGKPSNSSYKLLNTVGQTGPGLYSGTNYKVRAGFEYILSIIPFRFKIDNIFIDFGSVSPTIPVLRTNKLTVSNGSAFGYQVTVLQNHNLRADASGDEIPATACDGPSCTITTAAPWTSALTYGFGYRCDNITGTDCDNQFLTSTDYYRPFTSPPSNPIIVMSNPNVGKNKVSQITYKLNISGSQESGTYRNVLNYIAMPTF